MGNPERKRRLARGTDSNHIRSKGNSPVRHKHLVAAKAGEPETEGATTMHSYKIRGDSRWDYGPSDMRIPTRNT